MPSTKNSPCLTGLIIAIFTALLLLTVIIAICGIVVFATDPSPNTVHCKIHTANTLILVQSLLILVKVFIYLYTEWKRKVSGVIVLLDRLFVLLHVCGLGSTMGAAVLVWNPACERHSRSYMFVMFFLALYGVAGLLLLSCCCLVVGNGLRYQVQRWVTRK